MNLKINTAVNITIGGNTVSDLYGTITQYARINPETGGLTVPCALKFWLNQAACDANKAQVYPEFSGEALTLTEIELTAEEAAAPNQPYIFYTKCADKISLDYSIDVTVEL